MNSVSSIYHILYCIPILFIKYSIKIATISLFLLIVFLISLILNIFLYYNPENFNIGGSLVILFYSGIISIITLLIVIIEKFLFKLHN